MTTSIESLRDGLRGLVGPGTRVAFADGAGAPIDALGALSDLATEVHDVSLVLGWTPRPVPIELFSGFADVRALMSGWGLRRGIDTGLVGAVCARLSAATGLLEGPLRPDLLVATLVPRKGELYFGTESSWMRRLVEAGVPVAAVVDPAAPCADAGGPLPAGAIRVIGETTVPAYEVKPESPGATEDAIAEHVADLVPAGARVQVGPGRLGTALLAALRVPVQVDSGLLPDGVVDLDERGLLLGTPTATYLAGSRRLYDWADGRSILRPLEWTHDPGRLANGTPFIALNTALEIDVRGQVNAEGTAASTIGGVGGHPDFAGAAARSPRGLSVIALATRHGEESTLVSQLSRPVTTPSHDVDVVVNERGAADLRGLTGTERAAALSRLWDGAVG